MKILAEARLAERSREKARQSVALDEGLTRVECLDFKKFVFTPDLEEQCDVQDISENSVILK